MLKILYDHQIFVEQKYGGISRYICEIAQHIDKKEEFQTCILAPFYINQYLKGLNPQLVKGVLLPKIPKTTKILSGLNHGISRLLLDRTPPDLIHETYYTKQKIAPRSSKTVLTVYDMIHEKFPYYFPKQDTTAQAKFAAVSRVDHIICISEQTKKDLIEIYNVNPNRISVVYMGCSFRDVKNTTDKATEPYLLYVGNREGYKNFAMLLKAYAQSSILNKNFKLVCFGAEPFTAQELTTIHQLGLTQRVLHQSGNDELLTSLYQGAALFVYPSLYEGFGIPPLEAMSCCCPVACSNVSSIPEVVGQAAELFDPTQLDSIISSLTHVLFSDQRHHELIQLGLQRIKDFTWQQCSDNTISVYQNML